jgi:uncharacterized membrane protein YjgN (DUF898 family)
MSDVAGSGFIPQTLAAPAGQSPAQHFEYHGRLGRLYWLFLKNLLLSIVTFGIYRFWGRTNIRRYIWSNARFMGDALEYTGKGSELFIGFLIVFGLFFVTSAAIQFIVIGAGYDSVLARILDFVFPVLVAYFIFVAQYAAQRYRLTRTVWRGLRGGMTGSAWSYGGYAFGVTVLSGLTLTLAYPWARSRMIERRLENSYFGDAKVSLAFSSRPLFVSYIVGFAAFLVGGGILGYGIYWLLFEAGMFYSIFSDWASMGDGYLGDDGDAETSRYIGMILFLYVIAILLASVYASLCFAWFNAATAREVAAHATFQDLRFASSATGGQIAWLAVGNMLLIVLTLYLAYPVVVQRTLRFIVRHLHVMGTLDMERLRQTTLPKSRTGEGLLEVFDPGLF